MKKIVLLVLLLVLGLVNAVEINAPKEIPANLNWSFSIELNPSDSFTETEIYFDDLLIVTAYNDKQPVTQEDFVLKAFLFDKKPEDNSGLTVFVSYFGIEEGKHKIKTKTFSNGNLTEEKENEVESIDTINAIANMPDTFKQDLDILMKEIINKINDGKQELESLKNSTEQNVQQKTNALEQEIKQMEETLNELNKIKETENIEQEALAATETEQEKKDSTNILTGFYNFSVGNAWMGVIFLIVLIVLMVLFQIYKIKSNQTVFEDVLTDKDLEKEFTGETSLEEIEEESEREKKKSKRFSIGDLIRK